MTAQSVWAALVSRGDISVRVCIRRDCDPWDRPSTLFVSTSGLVSCTRRPGDLLPQFSAAECSRLLTSYAAEFAKLVRSPRRVDQLLDTSLDLGGGSLWAYGVIISIVAAHTGATWRSNRPDAVPPWCVSRSGRVVWLPDDPGPGVLPRHVDDLQFWRSEEPGNARLILRDGAVLQWRLGNTIVGLHELAAALNIL